MMLSDAVTSTINRFHVGSNHTHEQSKDLQGTGRAKAFFSCTSKSWCVYIFQRMVMFMIFFKANGAVPTAFNCNS